MDYSRYHSLSCERQDKVLIVSLNQPEALNAINVDLHTELSHVFADIALDQETNAVVLTGKSSLETAVAALRHGAFDYLTKPCKLVELQALLKRVAEKRELTNKYIAIKRQLERIAGRSQLIGESDEMLGFAEVATVNFSGLVTGSPSVATVTDPELAPSGTLTVSNQGVAASTAAVVPLNLTVFDSALEAKPVPAILIVCPTSPLLGLS